MGVRARARKRTGIYLEKAQNRKVSILSHKYVGMRRKVTILSHKYVGIRDYSSSFLMYLNFVMSVLELRLKGFSLFFTK